MKDSMPINVSLNSVSSEFHFVYLFSDQMPHVGSNWCDGI